MTEESKINRIIKIIEAVQKTAEGDFSFQIEMSGKNDEIDMVADAINRLVKNMSEHIAEKSKTEAALRVSEEKYRRLKANIPGMVYLFAMNTDGTFSFPYVNDASRQLFDAFVPRQRDIIAITFDPQSGHEQKARRPAFVAGLAIVCPITNTERGFPFHASIPRAVS